jgi:PAS domain S-box-containing protein
MPLILNMDMTENLKSVSDFESARDQDRSDLLDAVISNLPYAFCIFDADLRLVQCNDMYLEFLDFPPKLGKPGTHISDLHRENAIHGLYGPCDIEEKVETLVAEAKQRIPRTYERHRSDGQSIKVYTKPLPDGGLLITYHNITEHKATEKFLRERRKKVAEQLEQSENQFRDYADTAADWFWEMGADLRFTYFSERIEEVVGVPVSQMIGRTRPEVSHEPCTGPNWEQHLDDLNNHRPFHNFRFRAIGINNEPYYLSTSGKPVFCSDGKFLGYRGSATDISAEVNALRSLQDAKEHAEFANRSKTTFLANMSHELRTPLNAIIGFSDILTTDALGKVENEAHLSYIEDINRAGNHLLQVINDILDVARIEVGEVELFEEDIDLHEICESCINLVSSRAQQAQISIDVDIATDIPNLLADKTRIKQTLINLLTNSLKFSDHGTGIVIKVQMIDDAIELKVIDNGAGIAKQDLETIFRPFTQVHDDFTRAQEGAGLGLALVKSMMDLHNGRVKIDSAIGIGTSVTLTFPSERTIITKQYKMGT